MINLLNGCSLGHMTEDEIIKFLEGTYIVGGALRDIELGLKPKDIDYMVEGTTEDHMIAMGFNRVASHFPVFLHPSTNDEWALCRTEHSTGVGMSDFIVETLNVSAKEDGLRRDLTMNALRKNVMSGKVIDDFGGLEDIKNKVLRPTSEAFSEDPLRLLRVARFYARYDDFQIHEDVFDISNGDEIRKGLIKIAKERIIKELEKVLNENKPSRYFRALLEMNILNIVHPEIHRMTLVPQRIDFHAEGSVFEHTMRTLDEACKLSEDISTRYAALYHDIGKFMSFFLYGDLYAHDKESIVNQEFSKLKDLKHPKSLITAGIEAAMHHHTIHKFYELTPKKIHDKMTSSTFPKSSLFLTRLLLVSKADSMGRLISTTGKELSTSEVHEAFNSNDYVNGAYQPRAYTLNEELILEIFRDCIRIKIDFPKKLLETPLEIKGYQRIERISKIRQKVAIDKKSRA